MVLAYLDARAIEIWAKAFQVLHLHMLTWQFDDTFQRCFYFQRDCCRLQTAGNHTLHGGQPATLPQRCIGAWVLLRWVCRWGRCREIVDALCNARVIRHLVSRAYQACSFLEGLLCCFCPQHRSIFRLLSFDVRSSCTLDTPFEC